MESMRINELKERLAEGKDEELDKFWNDLETIGSPLIETIEGDHKNSLVTYIYKGDEDTKNVIVVHPIESKKPIDNMMTRLLDINLWYKTYKIPNDVRFRYYFSINDNLDDDWGNRLRNGVHDKFNDNKLVFEDGHVISYMVMDKAETHKSFKEVSDKYKGTLKKYEFFSKELNEKRNVWIYVPCEYYETTCKYGVTFFTDGKEHINILKTKDILDNTIKEKGIKPIIGVFIESTENRGKELRCNDLFERFITEGLVPWIKNNYRTLETPETNTICGFSLGGLTALFIALRNPKIFGNVISQSGAYHTSMERIKEEINNSKETLRCYINVGALEDKEVMIKKNEKIVNMLREMGHFVHYETFKSGHDYLCWGEGLSRGLNLLIK